MYCTVCGARYEDSETRCPYCGHQEADTQSPFAGYNNNDPFGNIGGDAFGDNGLGGNNNMYNNYSNAPVVGQARPNLIIGIIVALVVLSAIALYVVITHKPKSYGANSPEGVVKILKDGFENNDADTLEKAYPLPFYKKSARERQRDMIHSSLEQFESMGITTKIVNDDLSKLTAVDKNLMVSRLKARGESMAGNFTDMAYYTGDMDFYMGNQKMYNQSFEALLVRYKGKWYCYSME